jgi:hypothetical protein
VLIVFPNPNLNDVETFNGLLSEMAELNYMPSQLTSIYSKLLLQSEFIAECFMRRAYLTGFTGSAGTAVVTKDKAAIWTDGRYFLQVCHSRISNCNCLSHLVQLFTHDLFFHLAG